MSDVTSLSKREQQVYALMAEGWSCTQIAAQLCRSVKTVSTHRERIARKLGLSSVRDLPRYLLIEARKSANTTQGE